MVQRVLACAEQDVVVVDMSLISSVIVIMVHHINYVHLWVICGIHVVHVGVITWSAAGH